MGQGSPVDSVAFGVGGPSSLSTEVLVADYNRYLD